MWTFVYARGLLSRNLHRWRILEADIQSACTDCCPRVYFHFKWRTASKEMHPSGSLESPYLWFCACQEQWYASGTSFCCCRLLPLELKVIQELFTVHVFYSSCFWRRHDLRNWTYTWHASSFSFLNLVRPSTGRMQYFLPQETDAMIKRERLFPGLAACREPYPNVMLHKCSNENRSEICGSRVLFLIDMSCVRTDVSAKFCPPYNRF